MILFFFQQYFVCDYAVNVDCLSAEGFYSLNDNFGVVVEERSDDDYVEYVDDDDDTDAIEDRKEADTSK